MGSNNYSGTEVVLSRLTPLRWSESKGSLEMDVTMLRSHGASYAKSCLILSLVLFAAGYLLADYYFASSAIAKLATGISILAGVSLILTAGMISILMLKYR